VDATQGNLDRNKKAAGLGRYEPHGEGKRTQIEFRKELVGGGNMEEGRGGGETPMMRRG